MEQFEPYFSILYIFVNKIIGYLLTRLKVLFTFMYKIA